MPKRICTHCGTWFWPSDTRQIYCGKRCSQKATYRRRIARRSCVVEGCTAPWAALDWCRQHYNRHYRYGDPLGGPPTPTECKWCGGELPPPGRTGPQAKYCGEPCRREAFKASAGYKRRLAAKNADAEAQRAERPDRECQQCGVLIPGSQNARRIYCSKKCSRRAARDRVTRTCEVEGCENKHLAKGLCGTHYNHKFCPDSDKRGKPETRRKALRKKTQLRRARMLDPEAEPIDRDEIGERDGWRCGLCGNRIEKSLPYPHPMSPSLDHIEPLSLGGRHIRENVQIAHLRCNVAKGNRGGGEQLLLIG